MTFFRISPLDTPDYEDRVAHISKQVWPEFMLQSEVSAAHWNGLYAFFPAFQFSLVEAAGEKVVAKANAVPLHWDGDPGELPDTGWDWAMRQSAADYEAGLVQRTLCAIQIAIAPSYQAQGLSSRMVAEMKATARAHGFQRLIAPVRPTLLHRYPLTPAERYITWTNRSGEPFDPWLRVHVRSGAKIVKVCPEAMRITGTVADWEKWTQIVFPESGPYIIPGALTPVHIDREQDLGVYLEPNVWMVYQLDARAALQEPDN